MPSPSPSDQTKKSSNLSTDDDCNRDFRDLEKGPISFFLPTQPASPTKEHFRDIDFLGPITLHRFFVLVWVVGSGVLFCYIQNWIWPQYFQEGRQDWKYWPYISILWLVSLPVSIATLIGALWFRYNTKLDQVKPISHNVVFRIVSRGIQRDCLMETIRRCQHEMKQTPLFPYLVEVVTDADVFEAPDEHDIIHLKVPKSYVTPNGALFKARSLHYACEHSEIPGNTWVVHLDEETQPTSSGIKGIAAMIADCEAEGKLDTIGQGTLLYHRSFNLHPFLTLVDMRRTSDDFGNFYLQHRLGVTLFGLHGAFIVCRHDKEAAVGFDLGPEGSITEDSWWVLLAMDKGYRTRWIDGYVEEQSTQSIMDFLKQRRRWYYGLSKVITQCPVPFRHRAVLFFIVTTWLIAPVLFPVQIGLAIVFTYVLEQSVPIWLRVLVNYCFSIAMLGYLTGFVANLREHRMALWRVPLWTLAMFIAMPFCMALEMWSVVMAYFAPCTQGAKGFHVVQKQVQKDEI